MQVSLRADCTAMSGHRHAAETGNKLSRPGHLFCLPCIELPFYDFQDPLSPIRMGTPSEHPSRPYSPASTAEQTAGSPYLTEPYGQPGKVECRPETRYPPFP